jgi:pre-mRNA-processing factor SLU7
MYDQESYLARSFADRRTSTRLERLVQPQPLSMRKERPSTLTFLVRPPLVHLTSFSSHHAPNSLEYIAQAPWYLDTGGPSLSHQRRPEYDNSSDKLEKWYDRGITTGPAAKKYRKGACENCGAITHKKQDCLERPRKMGAKFTNKDIAPDEVIQDVATGYAAKRDRWNGYDTTEHAQIYDEYGALEAARQKLREEQIDKQMTTDLAAVRKVAKAGKTERKDDDFGSSDDEDEDEEKYADAADAVGQKLDTKTRITVRNLRIREDTAKYLINLDPSSAYYDPKTRSMRDNPEENKLPEDVSLLFCGQNASATNPLLVAVFRRELHPR